MSAHCPNVRNCYLHLELVVTRFKTSTFGLLVLKIVVKMTFFSNAIPVLKICLLILFAMLLLMLLYYFLVLVQTTFSRSRGEKVNLISLLFPPEICLYLYFLLHFYLYFWSTFHFFLLLLLLLLFSLFVLFSTLLGCVENWQTFRQHPAPVPSSADCWFSLSKTKKFSTPNLKDNHFKCFRF